MPLKNDRFCARLGFRGGDAAAQLKPERRVREAPRRRGFRGGDAAAQLKLDLAPPGQGRRPRIPRRRRRGSIEALTGSRKIRHRHSGFRGGDAAAQLKHLIGFLQVLALPRIPRRRRRGSIEATASASGSPSSPTGFRGGDAAAQLKHGPGDAAERRLARDSAAATPRLN